LTKFFLRRPIFAAVCSLVVLLAGLIVLPSLPIAQYPRIAPPVVTVTATYLGASAQEVESSVTVPLETAINGVEGLRYISSTSTNNGLSTITCTFDLSRDLDRATADVQNAVQGATGLLPASVNQIGVQVAKNSGSFVLAMGLVSDNPQSDQIELRQRLHQGRAQAHSRRQRRAHLRRAPLRDAGVGGSEEAGR
jgi:HAE1 family hydrophobic/amphiphilic exporter-1